MSAITPPVPRTWRRLVRLNQRGAAGLGGSGAVMARLLWLATVSAALTIVFATMSAALSDEMIAGILTLLTTAILLPFLIRKQVENRRY